ncbi:MAG: TolC family protein [Bacteroidota bacterium]
MKLLFLVAVLCATVEGDAQQPAGLTLRDALAIGRANSRQLKIAVAKLAAASGRADEARAATLPTLKFEGSYKRLSDVDPFRVSVPFLPAPITISPTVLDNYLLRVGLQQPLFTGFRLQSAAESAEYLHDAAGADERSDGADLVLNITSAYWSLYQAGELKKVVDENVRRLETYEADVRRLMAGGLATRNDLLRIQVQLSNARLTRIDAENDLRLAAMALNNVMGRALDEPIALASAPPSHPDTAGWGGMISPDGVARALGERPDLVAMRSRVEAARAGVTAAQGGWWPQIALSASYFYSRPNPRYLPTRDEFLGTWEVGVGMQFDLWNFGATSAQTGQARASLRQSELVLEQMTENAALDVRRQQLAFRRAVEKAEVARLAVEQAEENLRITSDKFKNGLATSADLLDADVAVLTARNSHTGALVETELARARLARALGITE